MLFRSLNKQQQEVFVRLQDVGEPTATEWCTLCEAVAVHYRGRAELQNPKEKELSSHLLEVLRE